MKCIILENISTTIKIESLTLFNLGKPKIKFINISTQDFLDISKRVYKP
jgi:hypothetical protein